MRLTDLEEPIYEKYIEEYDFTEYLRDKTILITGSKGIVGSGLIRWILLVNQRCGTNTHIIASTRTPEFVPDYIDDDDSIVFCRFGEEQNLAEQIDYIIHAASPTSNKIFQEQPVETLRTIVEGTAMILELARKQENCTVLYLSSEEVYGTPDKPEPVQETFVGAVDSLNVRSCYPLGKKVSELLCKAYFKEYGMNVKIIRPTVILGLYQPYDSVKVEAEILRCILEGKNFCMKSSGKTRKCVIYTMDALTAIFTVLFKGNAGEAYNATNPDTYESVRGRADKAFARFNPDVGIEFVGQDISKTLGYLPERALQEDIGKIRGLGWRPLASMDDIYTVDLKRFSSKCGM